MNQLLAVLSRLPDVRPFVVSYWKTGDVVALLAMCDLVEESESLFPYHGHAAALRMALLGGCNG